MGQDPLFGARPRRGTSRAMLDRTLTAWRKAGTLGGDEHAALRSTLRDAADAVDMSRALLRDGHVSPFSHARTVALYREALLDAAGGCRPCRGPV